MRRHLGHVTHVARAEASFSVGVCDSVVGEPGSATIRRMRAWPLTYDHVVAVGMGGRVSISLANRRGEENG